MFCRDVIFFNLYHSITQIKGILHSNMFLPLFTKGSYPKKVCLLAFSFFLLTNTKYMNTIYSSIAYASFISHRLC